MKILKHSNQIIVEAVLDKRLTPAESRTFSIIADHCQKKQNGKWQSFPSQETIAELAGLKDTKTVRLHIKSLQEKGYILTVKSREKAKKYAHNVYTLIIEKLGFVSDKIKEAKQKAKDIAINARKSIKAAFTSKPKQQSKPASLTPLQAAKQAFQTNTASANDISLILNSGEKLTALERHQLETSLNFKLKFEA